MKKSRQQLGVLLLWVWILFFCEIFFLPLWKKIRRSLVAVSSNKNVTLDKLWFFSVHWNYFVFSKSHHFLYFFIREHFSARKCSLCQTMACTDRKSHKQRLLLLWDNKLLKKERDACRKFCFSNSQNFGKVKRASSVNLCYWQRFPANLRDASPLFCSTKVLPQWPKENGNFAKFQTEVSSNCSYGHVKWKFDILARNIIREAESFFSLSKHVEGKNLFFLESFSQMVVPDW